MRGLILLWVAILVGLAGYSPAFSELTMAVLEFDGTGNHLILSRSAFEGVEEVTVEAWVRWEKFAKDSPVFWFGMAGNSAKLYNDGDSRHLKSRFATPSATVMTFASKTVSSEAGGTTSL